MAEMDQQQEVNARPARSKLLSWGKYFLIALVIVAQTILAYTIIDKNYERLYGFVYSLSGNEPAVFQLGELIVNPAGTNGQRYLVVEISLELLNKEHLEVVDQKRQLLKHEINEVLSSRSVNQLTQFSERERMREELIRITNEAIGMDSVRNLYYTRYVMQ